MILLWHHIRSQFVLSIYRLVCARVRVRVRACARV